MAAIAGSLVGNTYELVEHALMHTEPRTVLLARRVSTTWQAIIQKSKPVQQALFFSPLRVADGKLTVEELYNKPRKIAFLRMPDGYAIRNLTVFKNPLIHLLLDTMKGVGCRPPSQLLPKSWIRPEASWRQMLLTQPPIDTELIFGLNENVYAPFDSDTLRLGPIAEFLDDFSCCPNGQYPYSFTYDYRLRKLESASQLRGTETYLNSLESKAAAAKMAREKGWKAMDWKLYATKLDGSI